jgi:hypothetical protein
VQAVLDVPVGADDLEKARGRERFGEDEVAAGGGRLAVDLAGGLDLADGLEPGKAVPFGEPGHVVNVAVHSFETVLMHQAAMATVVCSARTWAGVR